MLSIIIINFHSEKLIIEAISSFEKFIPKAEYEIIIVNNGGDLSLVIEQNFKNIQVLIAEKNIGFSAANNLGVQSAKGDHFLFLNPDVIFIDNIIDSCLAKLIENPLIGMIGCKLLNADRTPQSSYHDGDLVFKKLWTRNPLVIKLNLVSRKKKDETLRWITGAFVLMQKTHILENGLYWDADFFMYWEDVELSYRTRKKNLGLHLMENEKIIHIGGSGENASDTRFAIMEESKLKFIEKTKGAFFRKLYVTLLKAELRLEYYLEKRKKKEFSDMIPALQNELKFYGISKHS